MRRRGGSYVRRSEPFRLHHPKALFCALIPPPKPFSSVPRSQERTVS
jgi:hypothetical protein